MYKKVTGDKSPKEEVLSRIIYNRNNYASLMQHL